MEVEIAATASIILSAKNDRAVSEPKLDFSQPCNTILVKNAFLGNSKSHDQLKLTRRDSGFDA